MPENSKKVFIPLMLLVYSSCIPVVPFQGELSCSWFEEGPSRSFACRPLHILLDSGLWTLDSGGLGSLKTSRLFLLLRRTLPPPSRRVSLMNGNVEDLILSKCYLQGRTAIKMTS